MIEMYPDGNEYLFEGYNAADVPDPVEPPFSDNPFAYLEQGYYNLGDDIPPTAEWEEELLIEFYGDYYTSGEFLRDGLTRDNLLDDAFEYIDYNNSFGYSGYDYSGYGYGAYSAYCEEYNNVGKEPPAHSIERPVNIKMQQGPKCSAYSSSCLLRYYGKDIDTDKLYRSFKKLPDGSAVPSSVARKIKAKIHTRGKVSDIEKQIDDKKPVLVLIYYDKTPGWDNLHYVLVTGYDDEYIYIADSLHSSGERYYNRAVKRDIFEVMWNTSKSLLVKLFYGKNIWYEYEPKQ